MTRKKQLVFSVIIIGVFLVAKYGASLVYPYLPWKIHSVYISTLYVYGWWLLPSLFVPVLLFPGKRFLELLGFHKSMLQAFGVALLTVAPMLLSSAIIGDIDSELDWFSLFRGTIVAGFMEELLYRAFLFGLLFRYLKWGFIPAALLGAAIFGLNHLYQSNAPWEAVGIFMVTFGGAGWFAWLFIEWDENIWLVIFLHILMNLSWALFNVGDTALGNWLPNVFRIMTIAFTMFLTILRARKRGYFAINRQNLWKQGQS